MARTETGKDFAAVLDEAAISPDHWTEVAIMEFSRGVRRMLERRGASQRELARELEKSEAYVSKVLRSADNLTIKQMQRILDPLQAAAHIVVIDRQNALRWREEPRSDRGELSSTTYREEGDSQLSVSARPLVWGTTSAA